MSTLARAFSAATAVLLLPLGGSATAGAVPAQRAQAVKPVVFNLPSAIVIKTSAHPGPNDPDRCVGAVFIEFPHIGRAKEYSVRVDDLVSTYDATHSGPPFPSDSHSDYPALFTAPQGFHRFFLNSYSTGAGCPAAILALEGRWRITRSKVAMRAKFSKQWDEPYTKCAYKKKAPLNRPVRLGKPGARLLIAKRGGQVRVRRVGESHFRNVHNSTLEVGAFIVETSTGDRQRDLGAVNVGALDAGGEKILIGPGMRVRIEAGKPVEVLRRTPGLTLDDIPKKSRGADLLIRTSSCVIAARG